MKKITLILLTMTISLVGYSQGNGNGNGNGNGGNGNNGNNGNGNSGVSNNWGQNGNGNAYGLGNGNNGNGGNNSGSSVNSANVSSAASQATRISLSNAIEVTFTGNMSTTGADVTIPFTTVNDYANGVESDAQELKVRSNKNFSVAVKANAAEFSYTGNTNPAPEMPVEGVLAVKVTANGTGGSIAGSFSEYATLTSSNQDLITAADRGGNQTFSVKYKATPGFAYPAGTYAVDVVYTATQE